MIRRHATVFRAILMLTDVGLALLILLAVASLRFGSGAAVAFDAVGEPAAILPIYAIAWVTALYSQGLYRPRARWTWLGETADALRATVIFAAVALSFLFAFKLPDVSRALLLLLFPSLFAAAVTTRVALWVTLGRLRRRGGNTRFMLVLGANRQAVAFAGLVERHRELGLEVIGHLRSGPDDDGGQLRRPLLGELEDLETIFHDRVVDEVAICLPLAQWHRIDAVVRLCQDEGKIARMPLHILERTLLAGRVEELDGVPIYSMAVGPDRALGLAAKRIVDIAVSALLLFALAPVMAIVAVAIVRDSPGPAIFRQRRVGVNGRVFNVIKFRTMSVDAEQRLEELLQHNEIRGPAFKIAEDPRITRSGRWMRRTSLDELPQLWNVLRGQMSLVGPRPPLPIEVAKYDVWHRRRLSMKPGITGLWQVDARRDPDFDRWVETDLQYIDNWSFWLDLKIIARTVPAVLSGSGR
jgi:exopolysaccharide biosynthesis polyprenyl glycosylphosphotransferase